MALAKSRDWTDTEVQEAVAAIKIEPGLWEELARIERTTGNFENSEAWLAENRILSTLHPECGLHEITQLYVAVRKHRRDELGL
jgi:hypothetical protein